MNDAHEANLSTLMTMLNRYRDASQRFEDLVECHECGKWHKPDIKVTRGRNVCSEECFYKWMEWGRWLR